MKKDKDEVCIDEFIKLVKKYNHIEKVTDEMLFELIDRVEIGVSEVIENTRVQDIEIYFNFIGDCVIPYTEDEVKKMKEREEREKIERESNPQYLIEKAKREHRAKLNKMKIKELEIVAKTDEVAKEILETRRAKNKEKNKKYLSKKNK